jgi:X-Pro dipeptidyl-peptidase (S15 family)
MPASQALKIETNVAVPMRDGTILYADLYRPEGPGPYPVLLQRTPYDKTMPLSFTMLDPLKAAKRGYAVVIQDSIRSGCENRNHAAACDFWSLLGSRDGAASPRKAASCAAVRYAKTLRCCCFNVATTVIMFATKREPSSL